MNNENFISKKSLLPVNATIVAGLLILLTISMVASESILDLEIKSIFLEKELGSLLRDYVDIKKDIEITEGRKNVTAIPDLEENGVRFSIPPPPPYLYASEKEIEDLFRENYRERAKTSAAIQAYQELGVFEILLSNPTILVSILIIPFLVSMLIEAKNWFFQSNQLTKGVISAFITGIAIMLLFFIVGVLSQITFSIG